MRIAAVQCSQFNFVITNKNFQSIQFGQTTVSCCHLHKLCTAPDGHEDVAEGEPVGDVEQHEGGGEHYPGYAVLPHFSINTRAVNGPSRSFTV